MGGVTSKGPGDSEGLNIPASIVAKSSVESGMMIRRTYLEIWRLGDWRIALLLSSRLAISYFAREMLCSGALHHSKSRLLLGPRRLISRSGGVCASSSSAIAAA